MMALQNCVDWLTVNDLLFVCFFLKLDVGIKFQTGYGITFTICNERSLKMMKFPTIRLFD